MDSEVIMIIVGVVFIVISLIIVVGTAVFAAVMGEAIKRRLTEVYGNLHNYSISNR